MSHPRGSVERDDEYATCVETFSTLRIFSDDVPPEYITDQLGVAPTSSFNKGERFGEKIVLQRKANGWFLSTEGVSPSRDTRRHIEIILDALRGKTAIVHALQAKGCDFDITSYFVSVGQGGPALRPNQMSQLGELGIDVWWDVYFQGKDET